MNEFTLATKEATQAQTEITVDGNENRSKDSKVF